ALKNAQSALAHTREQAEGNRSFLFLRHLLSAPFIYLMIVPLAILDITVTVYQHICFRLYGIPRVHRGDHFIIDRQLLGQLTLLNKFNCVYCGYGNGSISYAREIISRTEQYWCPIKHAHDTPAASDRYNKFLEYGDTENYRERREGYREDLRSDEKIRE
ncbi:MAG: hypothetical protein OXU24_03385, partial [Gammaproteobacteria bacterium]|nr:hypothetical protein [Gammaproteobacteria bacterium]